MPVVVHEDGKLVCRECTLYPKCYGYCTSADMESSGPTQIADHLYRHALVMAMNDELLLPGAK